MKGIFLCFSQVQRLLLRPGTWLTIFLTVLSPLAGLTVYQPASASTMLTKYLANPSLAGGTAGGIIFGLFTIYELDREKRNRVDVLTEGAVSPLRMAWVRLLALTGTAVVTLAAAMVIWLPITGKLTGNVFAGRDYVLAYILFMGFGMELSVLAASAAFQAAGRGEFAVVLFAVFSGLSLTIWADNWQLCWLNPSLWAMSDDFSNSRLFREIAYMRLTWLAALTGVWAVSWLCIRQYGKGLFASFFWSARKVYRPFAAILLLSAASAAYLAQPFYDNSNPDLSAAVLDHLPLAEGVTCLSRRVWVYPDTEKGAVDGRASYQLRNTSGKEQMIFFGVAPGYRIISAAVNEKAVSSSFSGDEENNMALWKTVIPADEKLELVLEYGGFPKEWNILTLTPGTPEISEEYLCLENQNMAPYLLNASSPEDGVRAAIEITVPDHMTVIPFGPGQAEVIKDQGDGKKTWRYEGRGFGGIVYAGDYLCQEIEAGGIQIQFYYGRKHQKVMEEAKAAEAIKAVVNYCTSHYGALSFGENGRLKLIQSRVIGGGYAGNGASLLDEGDFTAANLNNKEKGAVPGEVMIHELVHQWWGLANMFDEADAGPWSSEGLTVYTTYRIVKELYGEEYARKNYLEQWKEETKNYYLNFYVRNPEYLKVLPEDKRLDIANGLSSLLHYSEMPLKILKAEQLVGGEEAMDQILSQLFNRELDPAYPFFTYENFLDACGLTEEELSLEQDISI